MPDPARYPEFEDEPQDLNEPGDIAAHGYPGFPAVDYGAADQAPTSHLAGDDADEDAEEYEEEEEGPAEDEEEDLRGQDEDELSDEAEDEGSGDGEEESEDEEGDDDAPASSGGFARKLASGLGLAARGGSSAARQGFALARRNPRVSMAAGLSAAILGGVVALRPGMGPRDTTTAIRNPAAQSQAGEQAGKSEEPRQQTPPPAVAEAEKPKADPSAPAPADAGDREKPQPGPQGEKVADAELPALPVGQGDPPAPAPAPAPEADAKTGAPLLAMGEPAKPAPDAPAPAPAPEAPADQVKLTAGEKPEDPGLAPIEPPDPKEKGDPAAPPLTPVGDLAAADVKPGTPPGPDTPQGPAPAPAPATSPEPAPLAAPESAPAPRRPAPPRTTRPGPLPRSPPRRPAPNRPRARRRPSRRPGPRARRSGPSSVPPATTPPPTPAPAPSAPLSRRPPPPPTDAKPAPGEPKAERSKEARSGPAAPRPDAGAWRAPPGRPRKGPPPGCPRRRGHRPGPGRGGLRPDPWRQGQARRQGRGRRDPRAGTAGPRPRRLHPLRPSPLPLLYRLRLTPPRCPRRRRPRTPRPSPSTLPAGAPPGAGAAAAVGAGAAAVTALPALHPTDEPGQGTPQPTPDAAAAGNPRHAPRRGEAARRLESQGWVPIKHAGNDTVRDVQRDVPGGDDGPDGGRAAAGARGPGRPGREGAELRRRIPPIEIRGTGGNGQAVRRDGSGSRSARDEGKLDTVLHKVEPNENFWTISRMYYNSGRYYKALWKANADRVPRIKELHVDTVIRVPPPEDLDPSYIDPPGTRPSRPEAETLADRGPADEPAAEAPRRTARGDGVPIRRSRRLDDLTLPVSDTTDAGGDADAPPARARTARAGGEVDFSDDRAPGARPGASSPARSTRSARMPHSGASPATPWATPTGPKRSSTSTGA
ncbi:MAG: hypothetical protein U0790_23710 [Isosphaeraceae bacterium]